MAKPKRAEQATIPGQRSWASVVKAPVTTVRKLKTSWADQCEIDEPATTDAMEDEEWDEGNDAPPQRTWTSHPNAPRISLATPRGRSPALDEPAPKKPKAEGEADILRQVIADLRQQNQQLQNQLAALTQQVATLTQQVIRGQSAPRSSDEDIDEDEDQSFYHETDQCLQTYLQYPQIDPTHSRWSHLTLHRTPWEVMYPKCRDMQWENVSGQHNLCFWRCAQRQLVAANHAHRSKEPEDIKQIVMAHALANADRIAQDTGFDTATFAAHAQQTMQRGEMATEHCIAAFVDFYQVRVLVMHKEHQAAWIYIPAGETMAGPSMLVWLHQQHFQSGPTFDLTQINHAISSNADEQAFKSFCLRGGHQARAYTVTAATTEQGGVREIASTYETELLSVSHPQIPIPHDVHADLPEDIVMDVTHKWPPQAGLVPTQRDAPACVLAGESIAMKVMMLITSDLCSQVMQHPSTTGCDACTTRLARDFSPQQPTSDKGTWTKWLIKLVMHVVQLVPDFQPTNQMHLLSEYTGPRFTCRECCRAYSTTQWRQRHKYCEPPLWTDPNQSTPTSTARVEPMQPGTGIGDQPHHAPHSLPIGYQCRCCRPTDFHSTPGRFRPNHTRDITPQVMDAGGLLAR
eukprot:6491884-Amphidinium_carterae.1